MDEIDRKIVALLRENARRSFKDIGGYVHLTAPAVKRRVDRLVGSEMCIRDSPHMDEIDRKIVALLRENARRSFKDIGGYVHLTAPVSYTHLTLPTNREV